MDRGYHIGGRKLLVFLCSHVTRYMKFVTNPNKLTDFVFIIVPESVFLRPKLMRLTYCTISTSTVAMAPVQLYMTLVSHPVKI